MRSQDSVHFSSQFAVGTALEDTVSSIRRLGHLPRSSETISLRALNSAFAKWRLVARAHSASPGPQRLLSPLGVSVVQHHSQLVEQVAKSAMSGIGRVTDETVMHKN